ncbi:metallophosphoesterase family protein [Cohnella sp. JJ-181]|uniref:metallophosphoesterase family protein n=1 Tax=Cohnella rhizoplanae TaxID=2974897 RepID=UPI0022FF77CD|nr:metallophosphoesterase [Cohnella sp. JJ-181]CAI6084450.1 Bis(5'-nucleosyl)-tetraphosphatase, symmetrical [Cohnella sp. JJ-181]
MTRILVISDIHGHAAAMQSLLRMADYAPGADRLYLLGDFINRERESWPALGEAMSLVRQGARAVLGNMERWLLDASARGEGLPADAEELRFLDDTPLYWQEGGYLFAHAGVRPGLPPAQQSAADLTEIRGEFWGDSSPLPYTVVFGHTPTFKLGAAAGELWLGPARIGIDTGAKHGCRLTLVDLTNRLAYSCRTEPGRPHDDCRTASWATT